MFWTWTNSISIENTFLENIFTSQRFLFTLFFTILLIRPLLPFNWKVRQFLSEWFEKYVSICGIDVKKKRQKTKASKWKIVRENVCEWTKMEKRIPSLSCSDALNLFNEYEINLKIRTGRNSFEKNRKINMKRVTQSDKNSRKYQDLCDSKWEAYSKMS